MNMNQKIDILGLSDGGGGRYPTEPEQIVVRSCWAFVQAKGMKDYQTALQNQTLNELSFTIRQSQLEITTDMKVRFKGEDLNIKEVFFDHVQKKYTEIIAAGVS